MAPRILGALLTAGYAAFLTVICWLCICLIELSWVTWDWRLARAFWIACFIWNLPSIMRSFLKGYEGEQT